MRGKQGTILDISLSRLVVCLLVACRCHHEAIHAIPATDTGVVVVIAVIIIVVVPFAVVVIAVIVVAVVVVAVVVVAVVVVAVVVVAIVVIAEVVDAEVVDVVVVATTTRGGKTSDVSVEVWMNSATNKQTNTAARTDNLP